MEEEQKKHSRSCAFCLYEVYLLISQKRMRIAATCARVALFCGFSLPVQAVDNAVRDRPLHRVYSVAIYACSVREAIQRTVSLRRTGVAVQHGNELLAGDVYGRVSAVGNALAFAQFMPFSYQVAPPVVSSPA